MTREEAIKYLLGYVNDDHYTKECEEAHRIAIKALKEMSKQTEDKVNIGDEIHSEKGEVNAVVHHIEVGGRYQCLTSNGTQFILEENALDDDSEWDWEKTGRHFPQVAELLEQMQEVEK